MHYGVWCNITNKNWPLIGPMQLNGTYLNSEMSGIGTAASCVAGELCATWIAGDSLPCYAINFNVKNIPTCRRCKSYTLPKKVYNETMRDKSNHKYSGNRYYNFLVVFVGLFFAAYMIMPDQWRKPAPIILAVLISAVVAKFAASNRNRN